MKLAVISDVHSNIFGLRLALNDAKEKNVDKAKARLRIEIANSKYYVDGCDNDLINKKIKKRNKTLSVKLKQNKNNNYYKKFDYFDSSYKNKLPNDEANIILRKIEPFLIKEFKKNKNY